MKPSDWITYLTLATHSSYLVICGQTAIAPEGDLDQVCVGLHKRQRASVGLGELSWNADLEKRSKDIAASRSQQVTGGVTSLSDRSLPQSNDGLTASDKQTCAVFTGESWAAIETKFSSDITQLRALIPQWTYTATVAQQYESVSMAIWWSHTKVGCDVGKIQLTCCYDTIGNILNEQIVKANPVNVSSIVNTVLTSTPESIGNGIKNVADDTVKNTGDFVVKTAQEEVNKRANDFIDKFNPFKRRWLSFEHPTHSFHQ